MTIPNAFGEVVLTVPFEGTINTKFEMARRLMERQEISISDYEKISKLVLPAVSLINVANWDELPWSPYSDNILLDSVSGNGLLINPFKMKGYEEYYVGFAEKFQRILLSDFPYLDEKLSDSLVEYVKEHLGEEILWNDGTSFISVGITLREYLEEGLSFYEREEQDFRFITENSESTLVREFSFYPETYKKVLERFSELSMEFQELVDVVSKTLKNREEERAFLGILDDFSYYERTLGGTSKYKEIFRVLLENFEKNKEYEGEIY